jgi:hypothetical protein
VQSGNNELMSDSFLKTLLHMRLLVGLLGERAQLGWWSTAFYEPSGRVFLEPVFAKTARLAQYHGVVEAARRLHDEYLSAGSYHLFRMPEETEQDLHGLLQSSEGERLTEQLAQTKEQLLEALKRLAGKSGPAKPGPISFGKIKGVASTDVLRGIAAAYLWAFSQNSKTYPYLVA